MCQNLLNSTFLIYVISKEKTYKWWYLVGGINDDVYIYTYTANKYIYFYSLFECIKSKTGWMDRKMRNTW